MRLRHGWILCWLGCVGCQSLTGGKALSEPNAGEALWRRGQAAVTAGQPVRAISFYERSLAADPSRTANYLSLAAAHLEAGNKDAACQHLAQYLDHHPEQITVRGQFAELLLRSGKSSEARLEFARFAADAQDLGDGALRRRIHAHGRLMELAEDADDLYETHLERGIGMYLLACCRGELDEPQGELPLEGLLCKAAGELSLAHDARPEEARACWYLHAVWSRLGQTQPASRWLQAANAAAVYAPLTRAEQRSLQLVVSPNPDRQR